MEYKGPILINFSAKQKEKNKFPLLCLSRILFYIFTFWLEYLTPAFGIMGKKLKSLWNYGCKKKVDCWQKNVT